MKLITKQLQILRLNPRPFLGVRVSGIVRKHAFDALVFPEHAVHPSYEIGHSRISKLELRRLHDNCRAYHWERGLDLPAVNPAAQRAVDYLCEHIAAAVFGR
jgi:hypothetical protein